MAAITDASDYINRMTGGNSGTPEDLFFMKDARVAGAAAVATVAGRMTSLWPYEGYPSHGVNPVSSTGAALDNTTQGGLKQTDPGGGRQKWLVGVSAPATQVGTLILYDRLAQDGGFDGTVTTSQTVSFTPPSRYNNGIGNQIWLEIGTIIGTTGTTVTCQYENQSGSGSANATTPAVSIGGTGLREVGRIIPMTLAAGDTGVKNIADIDLAASTTTAGNIAALLVHPLCIIPTTQSGVAIPRDFLTGSPGPIEIKTDACLAFAWLAQTTTAPQIPVGSLHMVEA